MSNHRVKHFVQAVSGTVLSAAAFAVLSVVISCTTSGTIVIAEGSIAPATLIIGWEEEGELFIDDESFGQIVPGEPREIQIRKDGEVAVKIVGDTYTWVRAVTVSSGRSVEVDHFERDVSIVIRNEIFIEGGTFQMGTRKGGEDNERPVHSVRLNDFFLMKTEVIFADYDLYTQFTGADLFKDYGWGRGNNPVINISWYDTVAYANWLSEKDGFSPAYQIDGLSVTWDQSSDGWRLPTEAEWEFAARGGTQSRDYFYAGGNSEDTVAWYSINSGRRIQPVAGKQANELGLHDMSGNVSEWCYDWYGDYTSGAQTNPPGPSSGGERVFRGGSWYHGANGVRVAARERTNPGMSYSYSGFRLARNAVR